MNNININAIDFNGASGGAGGSIVLPSISDFPDVGKEGMIYIDNSTKLSYFWDNEHLMYQGIRSANRNPTPGPETDEGIYIKYTDGTISAVDTLIEGKTPVGIAYYSNNLKIVMHPNLTGNIDWNGGTGACTIMIFADGSQGRMPDRVELNAFYQNREQVNIGLTTINGDLFSDNRTWSSNQYDSSSAWVLESGGNWNHLAKSTVCIVRAICDF